MYVYVHYINTLYCTDCTLHLAQPIMTNDIMNNGKKKVKIEK